MAAKPRVALFIDAENASAKHFPDYLKLCRELGKPTIARCYGGSAGLKKWEKAIAQHHIVPVLTPPSASKQNAADFALTIDAVSLLHRDIFDHAVIASSDADFIQLAIHIREHGKGIHGIGETKATGLLRSAFDGFVVVGDEPPPKAAVAKAPPPPPPPAASKKAAVPAAPAIDTKKLLMLFREHQKDGNPVSVQVFGKVLSDKLPKSYRAGHGTLTNYLRKSGAFTVANNTVALKA